MCEKQQWLSIRKRCYHEIDRKVIRSRCFFFIFFDFSKFYCFWFKLRVCTFSLLEFRARKILYNIQTNNLLLQLLLYKYLKKNKQTSSIYTQIFQIPKLKLRKHGIRCVIENVWTVCNNTQKKNKFNKY